MRVASDASDRAETAVQLVHRALQARREAEARQVARKLIKGYIDPHYKVVNMQSFYSALVAALKISRMRGEDDAGDVLTLTDHSGVVCPTEFAAFRGLVAPPG